MTNVNVRTLKSSTLLAYDALRKQQNATWNDIDWEEIKLLSGSGDSKNETHVNIVSTSPAWKELFNAQRQDWNGAASLEGNGHCDIIFVTDDGYVPAHGAFLRNKSDFLDGIIDDNLQASISARDDPVRISLTGVKVRIICIMLTLLYTGRTVFTKDDEEELQSLMKMLQIDHLKLNQTSYNPAKEKGKKRVKLVTGFPLEKKAKSEAELINSISTCAESVSVSTPKTTGPCKKATETDQDSATFPTNLVKSSTKEVARCSTEKQLCKMKNAVVLLKRLSDSQIVKLMDMVQQNYLISDQHSSFDTLTVVGEEHGRRSEKGTAQNKASRKLRSSTDNATDEIASFKEGSFYDTNGSSSCQAVLENANTENQKIVAKQKCQVVDLKMPKIVFTTTKRKVEDATSPEDLAESVVAKKPKLEVVPDDSRDSIPFEERLKQVFLLYKNKTVKKVAEESPGDKKVDDDDKIELAEPKITSVALEGQWEASCQSSGQPETIGETGDSKNDDTGKVELGEPNITSVTLEGQSEESCQSPGQPETIDETGDSKNYVVDKMELGEPENASLSLEGQSEESCQSSGSSATVDETVTVIPEPPKPYSPEPMLQHDASVFNDNDKDKLPEYQSPSCELEHEPKSHENIVEQGEVGNETICVAPVLLQSEPEMICEPTDTTEENQINFSHETSNPVISSYQSTNDLDVNQVQDAAVQNVTLITSPANVLEVSESNLPLLTGSNQHLPPTSALIDDAKSEVEDQTESPVVGASEEDLE